MAILFLADALSGVCFGQHQERLAWFYAGVGIVADSVPEKEWDETALKFRPILEALDNEISTQTKEL